MANTIKYPFGTLAVGQSFDVEGREKTTALRNYAYNQSIRLNRKFTVQILPSGCRVTRTA